MRLPAGVVGLGGKDGPGHPLGPQNSGHEGPQVEADIVAQVQVPSLSRWKHSSAICNCACAMTKASSPAKVIPADNILFASEMVGAVKGIDPRTGHHYDDTKRYIDQVTTLSAEDKHKIFEGNARKVYSRLSKRLAARASA